MNLTKRLLALLLTVCMVAVLVPAVAITAEAQPVSFAPVTIDEGETEVAVTFVANGNFEEDDEYAITYDTDVFTYSDAECVDGDVIELSRGKKNAGYPVLVDFYEDGNYVNETIGTVTFEIADGAAPGVYNFTDADSGEVVGTITIVAPSYEGFTLVFKADKTDVKPGDTFTITYKLYNIPEQGLCQYQFYNKFDSSFELSGVTVPKELGGFTNYGGGALGGGLCGTIAPNLIYANSTIGTATFTVKANAKNGAHTIEEKIMRETGFGYTSTENLPAPTVVPAVINVTGGSDDATYEEFTLEAKASVTTAEPGDTFTVNYRICTVPETGMGGFQFHVDFNSEVLEITKVDIPQLIEGHVNYGTSNVAGLICGTFQNFNFSEDSVVGTVTFKVKDGAVNGETEISFNTDTKGDSFYWQDVGGVITGTDGKVTEYSVPTAVPASVTISGGTDPQPPVATTYTVTWDVEGVTTNEDYEEGATPSYKGGTPEKAADSSNTYTFAGWSDGESTYTGELPAVTAAVTYTAVFDSTPIEPNKITYKWVVEGETVQENTVDVGASEPAYEGATPTKTATAQYTYTFKEWTKSTNGNVVTYTATFTETVNKYTVKWIVNGIPSEETYDYGATPSYKGGTPTKTGDAQYSYTFTDWTPAITTVTENVEYTAQFEQSTNKYRITFVLDADAGIQEQVEFEYGEIPSFEATKESTDEFDYTFAGWTPTIASVTGEATYTAQWTPTTRKYDIVFDVNGSQTTVSTEYGTKPVFEGSTEKTATAQYTFTFAGWSDGESVYTTENLPTVTGTKVYTATYTETVNKYKVTWVVEGVETTEDYEYGTVPSYKNTIPSKESTAEFEYVFSWDKEFVEVTENVTYTGTLQEVTRKYTITWIVAGVETTTECAYGTVPTFEGSTRKESTVSTEYLFIGWDKEIVTVDGEATYTAQYEEVTRQYVIFWNVDGEHFDSLCDYGTVPTFEGTPTKAEDEKATYEFVGWDPEVVAVTGGAEYTAVFAETLKEYTVTWIVDGVETKETYKYGETPAFTGKTDKAADEKSTYEFTGWDKEITAVVGDATYVAQYKATPKTGDTFNTVLWAIILVSCAAVVTTTVIIKKKVND